jgi:hypothetical protein
MLQVTEEAPLPLVGRREALQSLVAALRARRTRLILGPPGAGKTRLVQEAMHLAAQPCVLVQQPRVLHALLVELAGQLNCRLQRFATLRRATSISLKPVILDSLHRTAKCVVIEDVSDADPRMYRFLPATVLRSA